MSESACEHVERLRACLRENGLTVRGEFTDTGWVNVSCSRCCLTVELDLHQASSRPPRRGAQHDTP